MNNILITGSGGQLGQCLRAIHKNYPKLKFTFLSKNELDITNEEQLCKLFFKYKFKFCVNTAAYTNVDLAESQKKKAYLVNETGAKLISKHCKKHDVFLIHISTDYVFDGTSGPYYEDDITNPINVYGKSKLLGESIVEDLFDKYTILRTNILFGKDSSASFLNWVVNSLRNNQEIKVVNDQINNPVSVYDCSRTINQLITESILGKYHLGSDNLCSRFDFAMKIAEVWNLDSNLVSEISTKQLKRTLQSFKAERPLKSGLLSKFDFISRYSLENSIKEIKNI